MQPELDKAVSALYLAYVSELSAAFDTLAPWWAQLGSVHEKRELAARWPGRRASHPQILAIYRDYHARLSRLRPPAPAGPAPRFDDDEAWGSEAEPDPELLIPTAPRRLLIERLQIEAPELYREMIYLLMSPVGEAPEPYPSMRELAVVELDPRRTRTFNFSGTHGVERGVERLLGAGFDLRASRAGREGGGPSYAEASEVHRLAFDNYRRDLQAALGEAERWWLGELGQRQARGMSSDQARDDAYAAHPIGPVGHRRVLGVIQAYWCLCQEINAALLDQDQHVAPEILLLGWLRDGRHPSWVETLTAMPYWPVGQRRDGSWV